MSRSLTSSAWWRYGIAAAVLCLVIVMWWYVESTFGILRKFAGPDVSLFGTVVFYAFVTVDAVHAIVFVSGFLSDDHDLAGSPMYDIWIVGLFLFMGFFLGFAGIPGAHLDAGASMWIAMCLCFSAVVGGLVHFILMFVLALISYFFKWLAMDVILDNIPFRHAGN